MVADRIRLWAIAMTSAFLSYTTRFVLPFRGIDLARSALGAASVGGLGLVSAASAWLAFLPPAGYLRRVRARSEAASRELAAIAISAATAAAAPGALSGSGAKRSRSTQSLTRIASMP